MELPSGYRAVWKHYRIRHGWWIATGRLQSRHVREMSQHYSPSLPHFIPTTHGGRTECFLYGPDRQLVATGEAVCSIKDQFVYRVGRQISLGRALKQLRGE